MPPTACLCSNTTDEQHQRIHVTPKSSIFLQKLNEILNIWGLSLDHLKGI